VFTHLPHPLGLTSGEFCSWYPKVRGGPLTAYRSLFREGVLDQSVWDGDLPPVVRQQREQSPEGEVIKFALAVPGTSAPRAESCTPDASTPLPTESRGTQSRDTLETESVLIPMIGKKGQRNYTLCLSSQVGCAMGCTFCETAQMGLIRSLLPHEITAQWFIATHVIGIRPRNIVFMGMGEPMDNLQNVIQAIAVLDDRNGPAVAMNKITVSTVGRVDGIRRLAEKVRTPGWHRLNLAISINAPNDEIRSQIMPINRRWKMAELRQALLEWPYYGGAKLCIEYVLIPGVNDAREHAEELAAYVRPLRACINVIPYNPRRGSPWPAPEEGSVQQFLSWLVGAGAYCKRRRTKGRNMMGACGQLGNPQIRRRRLVGAVELTAGGNPAGGGMGA
jgi:23S rRNA (adenine2503-C2)-methyltransferase